MSEAGVVTARVSSTAVFKKPDFVLMWLAQLVSTAGSALTDLAAGIYVYSVTGSAFLVGVTLMATAIPSLVVGLIAGVFVDRWDRRRVMIASNLAQGVVVATIPFLLGVNVALLFVAILVNAGVKQFFDPAYEALIPEIASDEELTAANAFLQIASFGSTAIGFAGAGLLASIDIRLAFWIDALTFVFSAGCIYLMKTRVKMEVPDEKASVGVVVANLKIGVRTDLGHPDAALAVPARRAGVLRHRPVERPAAADGDHGPGRHGVPVRHPGGSHLRRVRARQPVHGPLRRPPPDRAVDLRRLRWGWASPGSCTACHRRSPSPSCG